MEGLSAFSLGAEEELAFRFSLSSEEDEEQKEEDKNTKRMERRTRRDMRKKGGKGEDKGSSAAGSCATEDQRSFSLDFE